LALVEPGGSRAVEQGESFVMYLCCAAGLHLLYWP
jgi:hypothetical protein